MDARTPDPGVARLAALLDRLIAGAPAEDGAPAVPLLISDDYGAAVVDLLAWLGAVSRADHGMVQVSSVAAGYLLRMARALLDLNTALVADWQREGLSPGATHPFGAAVDLLAALEQRRAELDPQPAPLRTPVAAVALIMRQNADDQFQVLLVKDTATRSWQLPGGRYEHGDASLRQTLLRELTEELGLPRLIDGQDIHLAEVAPPVTLERYSPTSGLLTRTQVQIFWTRFVMGLPSVSGESCWVDEAELRAGRRTSGEHIAAEPLRILLEERGSRLTEIIPLEYRHSAG